MFAQFHQPLNPYRPQRGNMRWGNKDITIRGREAAADGSRSVISPGFVFGRKQFISSKHSGEGVRQRENSPGHPPGSSSERIQTVLLQSASGNYFCFSPTSSSPLFNTHTVHSVSLTRFALLFLPPSVFFKPHLSASTPSISTQFTSRSALLA